MRSLFQRHAKINADKFLTPEYIYIYIYIYIYSLVYKFTCLEKDNFLIYLMQVIGYGLWKIAIVYRITILNDRKFTFAGQKFVINKVINAYNNEACPTVQYVFQTIASPLLGRYRT
jgi:hypothetical protein